MQDYKWVFELEPVFVYKNINILRTAYTDHMSELPEEYRSVFRGVIPGLEFKVLVSFRTDYRRYWRMSTVWYKDKPVMIIGNAGREGDDDWVRYVYDPDLYEEVVHVIYHHLISSNYYKEDGEYFIHNLDDWVRGIPPLPQVNKDTLNDTPHAHDSKYNGRSPFTTAYYGHSLEDLRAGLYDEMFDGYSRPWFEDEHTFEL